MRKHEFPLEDILAELQADANSSANNDWSPGFEGDRSIIQSKFGPLLRFYRKPKRFKKRFYQTVYELAIADWHIDLDKLLFGGFCRMNATLDLRYQASIKFALANSDHLAGINEYIKARFQGLILDMLEQTLRNLEQGDWVNQGLAEAKEQLETLINETMIVQGIQCRAICELDPSFERLADDTELDERFIRKSVYMEVMRQNFSFKEQQKQELMRQQDLLAEQELEHKKTQLQLLEKEGELLCIKQAKEAENQLRLIREQELNKEEKLDAESRIHARELEHKNSLKEHEYQQDIAARQQKQTIEHQAELILQENTLEHDKQINQRRIEHERSLKDQELEFEIEAFEKRQSRWNQSEFEQQSDKIKQDKLIKEQELDAEISEQEMRSLAQQKLEERVREEKINHERRLRVMELEAEQLSQRERFKATQNTDQFIRREIDLLNLEKQKIELNKEIKFAEEMLDTDKQ